MPPALILSPEGTSEFLCLAISAPADAILQYPGYRLCDLVTGRLVMSQHEALLLAQATGSGIIFGPVLQAVEFNRQLRAVIAALGLSSLFRDDGPGRYHHAIRPAGFDYGAGEVDALAMAQWRRDFRAMRPPEQMLAASIIWLYRGGKDSRWLRRVPCTWHAAFAIREMTSAGMLAAWGELVALYPGW